MKLFKPYKIQPDKECYVPTRPVFVPAISKHGEIQLKRVTEFSIHKMTHIYEIKHPKLGSFKATEDHSLVLYDKTKNEVIKVSPKDILENKSKYTNCYFIQLVDKNITPESRFNLNNCKLYPIHEFTITDAGYDDTYDLTVNDFQTFMLANGLFVQDTVAVYMPLTIEAQEEAKKKMFRKTKSIATGEIIFELAQGMILGLYQLTRNDVRATKTFATKPRSFDVEYLTNLVMNEPDWAYVETTYSGKKGAFRTTVGRILVNMILPNEVPFFDKTLNKKNIKELFAILNKYLDEQDIVDVYDKLRRLGFEYVSRCGLSMPITEFTVPKELKEEAEKVKTMDPDTGMKYINEVLLPKLKEYVKKNHPQIFAIFDSGSRGSWSDLLQMVLIKGYVEDAEGKVVKVPVTKGFIDNLNAVEAFIISPAARQGIINRSIRTAEAGYLTRRLVKAAANIKINFNLKDCHTKKYLEIEIPDEKWAKAVIGRYLADGTLITDENYKSIIGQKIQLRSPIFCKSPKICLTCYGELHKLLTSDNIGIQSAQIVGERGTQLIMKTFHTGGLAQTSGIPQIISDENPNLVQEGLNIITNRRCKVVIDKHATEYKLFEDRVLINYGLIQIYFDDKTYYEIDLESIYYALEFRNFIDMKVTDDEVILYYEKGQQIAELELMSTGLANAIQEVNRLFERRICKECTIEETLVSIYKHYVNTGRKLIHFEIILSNMVRSASNPYIPYRLSNDDKYIIIGISQVPFYTSPLLALSFQNVGKAIETGLLYPQQTIELTSDFEKIVLGEFQKEIET